MAVILNVRKSRLDKDGNIQRVKVKGQLPISFGYGIYLGDSFDDRSNVAKVFFLMHSADPSGNTSHPQQLMASPAFTGLSLDEVPFSKKFSIPDDFSNTFKSGIDYWFAYTSDAVNSLIDGKSVTYESLYMLSASDLPGLPGLNELLCSFKLAKNSQQNT